MAQFHFDPDSYLELMAEEVPDYARLQEEAAGATVELASVRRVLDLGTGTGEPPDVSWRAIPMPRSSESTRARPCSAALDTRCLTPICASLGSQVHFPPVRLT